jgi:hypothetical protein
MKNPLGQSVQNVTLHDVDASHRTVEGTFIPFLPIGHPSQLWQGKEKLRKKSEKKMRKKMNSKKKIKKSDIPVRCYRS